ncbi:MAG: dihydrofolate reductase [Opitutaceae bacterium]
MSPSTAQPTTDNRETPPRAPRFVAIVAMAENRVIGVGNQLPWHLPEDFKWFKQQTLGKTLLMGRKTFESIGRPLPGRTTLVLSRSARAIPGVTVMPSLEAISTAAPQAVEIMVCGGAEIYALTRSRWAEVFVTRVKRTIAGGDAFFPEFEADFAPPEVIRDTPEFTILHYRK